jgi:hypothetical protein
LHTGGSHSLRTRRRSCCTRDQRRRLVRSRNRPGFSSQHGARDRARRDRHDSLRGDPKGEGESWTFENHRTDFETQRQEWSGGKPADWAMEAFAFARKHSYGLLPRPSEQGTYSLPSAYVDQAVQDVALQLSRTISLLFERPRRRARALPCGHRHVLFPRFCQK